MARILYKNVKTKAEFEKAKENLIKAGLTPYSTDAGVFSTARKGQDVYALAKKKRLYGFKSKNARISYI